MNHLEKLFLTYPDKPWNYDSLAENPGLTISMIKSVPIDKWDVGSLAMNSNVPIDFIKQYYHTADIPDEYTYFRMKWSLQYALSHRLDIDPIDYTIIDDINNIIYYNNKDYNIKILCQNPTLDIDILIKSFPENIRDISENTNINNGHIEKYPFIGWDFYDVVKSPNIDIKRLLDFLYRINHNDNDKSIVKSFALTNPNINFKSYLNGDYADMDINESRIIRCIIYGQDFWDLFQNNHKLRKLIVEYTRDNDKIILEPNSVYITDEQIIASESWVLKTLQYLSNVPTKVFLTYYKFFDKIYKNIILTAEIFQLYPELVHHDDIYENLTLTWAIITDSGISAWNLVKLSAHPNINLSIIRQNNDKYWYTDQLSANTNLTAYYVIKNVNRFWDFNKLSANTFKKNQLIQNMETQEIREIHYCTIHELKMRHRDKVNRSAPIINNAE